MPVSYEHPDYKDMSDKWDRCIDVCKGQAAVHAAGEIYLPKLSEQDPAEYKAYKNRATFYNATWRTISGLQGMIFRKPVTVKVPAPVEDMLKNIDLAGTSLHMFSLKVAEECLKLGRTGVFVDYPEVPDGLTLADAKRKKLRPSMKMYTAKSIINWKTRTIDNVTSLSMVVLKEVKDVAVDEFENKGTTQYRVLDLESVVNEGTGEEQQLYRVRIMHVDKDGKDVVDSVNRPTINGKRLDYIPFQFMGVDDTSWEIDEPPLIDLVDVNLAHYRVVADYEHGCHFTGLPTPVISGYVADPSKDEKFCIGSMTAWLFPRPDAKATYLEFTGQGLSELRENLNKKEQYMAVLGARMLEPQVQGVEAADTAAIHRSGEQSTLSSVAQTISIGLQKSLETFCEYAEAEGDVKFELNRDFFPVPMDSLKLTAIIAGWQNGAYSYETMFENLKKGEIVPVEATVEKEQEDIKKHPYKPPVPIAGHGAPTTPGNVRKQGPKAAATPATGAPTQTQLRNNAGPKD
jgi:hypothetical protein